VPTRADHLTKAQANEELSATLQSAGAYDWAVTLLFCAALHLVEACLAPHGHAPNHGVRDRIMRSHTQLHSIYRQYRVLKDWSMDARYECRVITAADAQQRQAVEYQAIKNHLRPILGFTF
jgi:hypothetical protein